MAEPIHAVASGWMAIRARARQAGAELPLVISDHADWEELTRTPSRLTAEAPNREERARLLETVTRLDFIDDYSGVRISKTGRRFKISRATVWNLISENGQRAAGGGDVPRVGISLSFAR